MKSNRLAALFIVLCVYFVGASISVNLRAAQIRDVPRIDVTLRVIHKEGFRAKDSRSRTPTGVDVETALHRN